MKKTVLIVILFFVILLLSATLYLFIETAPKDIKDEEAGTMYSIGEISFNLYSNNYVVNKALQDSIIERGNDPEKINGWVDENNQNSFVLFYEEEFELFEETLLALRNPLTHLQLENELPRTEDMQERDIYKVDIDYYTSTDKIAILTKNYKNDGSEIYNFEMKIGNRYYTVIALQSEANNIALENIMEFMRTAHISQ